MGRKRDHWRAGTWGKTWSTRGAAEEALYTADELFFPGTASKLTPIRSVDKIPIGEGKARPVTLAIRKRFTEVVAGQIPDEHGWLALLLGLDVFAVVIMRRQPRILDEAKEELEELVKGEAPH